MKKLRYILFTFLVTLAFASVADVDNSKSGAEPQKFCMFGFCMVIRGGGGGWQPPPKENG